MSKGVVVQILGGVAILAAIVVYLVPRLSPPDPAATGASLLLPPEVVVREAAPVEPPVDEPAALAILRQALKDDPAKGREALSALISAEGETPLRRAVLGIVLLHEREPELAGAAFDRALELDPKLAMAYSGRGRLRAGTGDFAAAVKDLRRAAELMPRHAETWRTLAVMRLGRDRPREALKAAIRACRLDPEGAAIRRTIGDCLLRAGREAEAGVWFRSAPLEVEGEKREAGQFALGLIEAP